MLSRNSQNGRTTGNLFAQQKRPVPKIECITGLTICIRKDMLYT